MAGNNLTEIALRRQMSAMRVTRFEVGIQNRDSKEMLLRTWQMPQVIAAIPWLKYKNSQYHHIFIRPLGSTGLILLDDLSISQCLAMDKAGIYSACTVTTSELNYQSWVRVCDDALDENLATSIGEVLAKQFNADLAAKAWRQFGRAAGFTNVKHKHVQKDGRYPYVTVIDTSNERIENVQPIFDEAMKLQKQKADQDRRLRNQLKSPKNDPQSLQPSETAFNEAVEFLLDKYGRGADRSRVDWAAAKHMMIKGYTFDQIATAMLSDASINTRKKGHVEHYVLIKTLPRLFAYRSTT